MTLDVLPLQVRNRGPPPIYSDPDLFSLEIHHEGYISKGKYVRGKVTWADNCNADHLSMLDLYDVALCLGYDHKTIQYHYWNKRRGFVPIEVDAHVVEFVEHTPTSRVQPLYLSYKHQPHFSESQASASAPQLGLEVEVETETDVGDLGNQFVEVDVDLDDDGDDEADNEGDNEADEFEDDEAEDDDSGEEVEDDDSETDIELIDSEFEQSDEEGFKTVLEEDDNLFDKHVVDEENEEYNEEPGEVDSEDYNTDELVSLDEESDEDEGVKNRSRRIRWRV